MKKIVIKKAVPSDFDFFFKIKSEYSNIYWTGHKNKPDYQNLKEWFINNLNQELREIFILCYSNEKIGYIYLDKINSNELEMSIAIAERFQNKGLGYSSIKK